MPQHDSARRSDGDLFSANTGSAHQSNQYNNQHNQYNNQHNQYNNQQYNSQHNQYNNGDAQAMPQLAADYTAHHQMAQQEYEQQVYNQQKYDYDQFAMFRGPENPAPPPSFQHTEDVSSHQNNSRVELPVPAVEQCQQYYSPTQQLESQQSEYVTDFGAVPGIPTAQPSAVQMENNPFNAWQPASTPLSGQVAVQPPGQVAVQPLGQVAVQPPGFIQSYEQQSAQPATPIEPVFQPVAQPVFQPVAQPVFQPVVQPVVQPVLQPVSEPTDTLNLQEPALGLEQPTHQKNVAPEEDAAQSVAPDGETQQLADHVTLAQIPGKEDTEIIATQVEPTQVEPTQVEPTQIEPIVPTGPPATMSPAPTSVGHELPMSFLEHPKIDEMPQPPLTSSQLSGDNPFRSSPGLRSSPSVISTPSAPSPPGQYTDSNIPPHCVASPPQAAEFPNSPPTLPTLPVNSFGGVNIFKPTEVVEKPTEPVASGWNNDFDAWDEDMSNTDNMTKDFEDIQL